MDGHAHTYHTYTHTHAHAHMRAHTQTPCPYTREQAHTSCFIKSYFKMHALQALHLLDMLPEMINNVLRTLFRIFKLHASLLTCILLYYVGAVHIRAMYAHYDPCEFN